LDPRLPLTLLLLAATLLISGCPTTPTVDDEPPSARELDALQQRPLPPSPPPTTQPLQLSPFEDPSSPLYRRIVYFDYDTSEIRPQYVDLLRAHAAYLFNDPGARVTLEGHTDERGTRDYNLALGDRRSDAVKRYLVAEGVPSERISTLSYGEERPADPGHGENAWAKNRRVELVY
jgi:peptidoglycan-associated lipoprotein